MSDDLDKEATLKYYHDNYELHFKGANYLMVAHAAGFVGCLSVLKDYAAVPVLKGIGFYIIIFGIGMIASMLYYISLALARSTALNEVMQDKPPHEPTRTFLTIFHFLSISVAILMLLIAIFGLMIKLARL
jgi:hypothetical protein